MEHAYTLHVIAVSYWKMDLLCNVTQSAEEEPLAVVNGVIRSNFSMKEPLGWDSNSVN